AAPGEHPLLPCIRAGDVLRVADERRILLADEPERCALQGPPERTQLVVDAESGQLQRPTRSPDVADSRPVAELQATEVQSVEDPAGELSPLASPAAAELRRQFVELPCVDADTFELGNPYLVAKTTTQFSSPPEPLPRRHRENRRQRRQLAGKRPRPRLRDPAPTPE